MNLTLIRGMLYLKGSLSAISCQLQDTFQKKKVFKDQAEALGTQVSNVDNKSTQFVEPPACPSLEDGFGGSINIGRNSMGARSELLRGIAHRVHLQTRSSWLAGERTGRGLMYIAWVSASYLLRLDKDQQGIKSVLRGNFKGISSR